MGFSVELLGALGFAFHRQDPGAHWVHTSPGGLGLSAGPPSIAAGLAVVLQSPPRHPFGKNRRGLSHQAPRGSSKTPFFMAEQVKG